MGSTGAGGAGAVRGTTLKEKKLEGGTPPPDASLTTMMEATLKRSWRGGGGLDAAILARCSCDFSLFLLLLLLLLLVIVV